LRIPILMHNLEFNNEEIKRNASIHPSSTKIAAIKSENCKS
jgi:hypothetical protein